MRLVAHIAVPNQCPQSDVAWQTSQCSFESQDALARDELKSDELLLTTEKNRNDSKNSKAKENLLTDLNDPRR